MYSGAAAIDIQDMVLHTKKELLLLNNYNCWKRRGW